MLEYEWGQYDRQIDRLPENSSDQPFIVLNLFYSFFAVPWGCLRFVIVVFPDHSHLLLQRVSNGY